MSVPRPFRDDDAPGRIPESLIDAVLDGSVDDRTQREVARALRHDPRRRQDVEETVEAIDALREPVESPDFSGDVLASLDRKHRFLPARVRRTIRQARLGLGVAAMLGLVGVAVAQRTMPRLASIGEPETPISDVAQAVHADAAQAAQEVTGGVRVIQASLPGINQAFGLRTEVRDLEMPGLSYRLELDAEAVACDQAPGAYRLVAINGGRYLMIDSIQTCSFPEKSGDADGSLVSLMLVSTVTSDNSEGQSAGCAEAPEAGPDELP